MAVAQKLTLTPQEHRRVDAVMGLVSTRGGFRLCRCGEQVRWTPRALWEHTLACERRQQRQAFAGATAREQEKEMVERALDQAETDEESAAARRSSVGRNGSGDQGRESIMAAATTKKRKRGTRSAPSRARSATAAPPKRAEGQVSTREAVLKVMRRHSGPMELRDITDRVLRSLTLKTKTPRASVAKAISLEVHKPKGEIKKVGPGTYELRSPKKK